MELKIIPDGAKTRIYLDDRELNGVYALEIHGSAGKSFEATLHCHALENNDPQRIRLNEGQTAIVVESLRFIGNEFRPVESGR